MSVKTQVVPKSPDDLPKKRNELVRCPKCQLQMERKRLAKHQRTVHKPKARLILNSRACLKSTVLRACTSCGAQNKETWIFEQTSQGPVSLCSSCKKAHIRQSFNSQAMNEKRVAALKASLADLRKLEREHPDDAFHPNLKQEIAELTETLKKPISKPRKWSPILPGSFGSGKRR